MPGKELLWDGVRCRTDGAFPLGTDSIVLADFAALPRRGAVADLGCGAGLPAMLLAVRSSALRVTGLELSEPACRIAEENVGCSGLRGRVEILRCDLRTVRATFRPGCFDAAVSNPPYYSGSGDSARREQTCSLRELCAAASWLVRFGGAFRLVYRPERLADLFWELRAHALEPKRLRLVRHTAAAEPSVVLVESRRGGKSGLRLEPDLILFGPDGAETDETRRIYHR